MSGEWVESARLVTNVLMEVFGIHVWPIMGGMRG